MAIWFSTETESGLELTVVASRLRSSKLDEYDKIIKLIEQGIGKAKQEYDPENRYIIFRDPKFQKLIRENDLEKVGYSSLEEAVVDASFRLNLHNRHTILTGRRTTRVRT